MRPTGAGLSVPFRPLLCFRSNAASSSAMTAFGKHDVGAPGYPTNVAKSALMAPRRSRSLFARAKQALWCASLVAACAGSALASAPTGNALVMFEQEGCPYCAQWDRNVGRVYAKTDEAAILPLRRVDLHATRPADLRAIGGVRFTPTFVVMHCGKEVARITGYLGDEQFWGLLDAGIRTVKDLPSCS